MQHDRRHIDAAGDQAGDHAGRERPPRARHLGAAGLDRIHVLIGVERPVRSGVPVADRLAVAVEVIEQVAPAQVEVGDPEPRSHVARQQLRLGPVREQQPLTGMASVPAAVVRPQLDDPAPGSLARSGRREVKHQPGAAGGARRQRRGQGARGVQDQHVAGPEQLGQLVEVAVVEPARGRVGHEHQHAVAAQAALLGRAVRLAQLFGRGRQRAQAGTSTSSLAR